MTNIKKKRKNRYRCIKESVGWLLIVLVFLSFQVQVLAKETLKFKEYYEVTEEKFVEYCLKIPEKSHVAGVTIEIQYDSKQLKLVESSVGEILSSSINKLNQNIEGKVILTAISTEEIVEKGDVLNLKWEVINSTDSYLNIQCVIKECVNQECVSLNTAVETKKPKNPLYKGDDVENEYDEELKTDKEKTENKEPKENEPLTSNEVGEEKKNKKSDKQNVDSKNLNKQKIKNNNDKKSHSSGIAIAILVVVLSTVAISFIAKIIRRKRK